MAGKLNIDKLDLQIIQEMVEHADTPYAELGKKLFVSAGTIHVRIKKMQEAKIITGTQMKIDLKKLGFGLTTFVGVFLEKSSLYDVVAKELEKIPEIVRLNYTTGNYTIFLKVLCKDNDHLMEILNKIQKLKGVTRTETFISLEQSISRQLKV